MTHSHLSLQTEESSDNNRTFVEDPLQEFGSPDLLRLSDLHETEHIHNYTGTQMMFVLLIPHHLWGMGCVVRHIPNMRLLVMFR
jgi:hypothetical protein